MTIERSRTTENNIKNAEFVESGSVNRRRAYSVNKEIDDIATSNYQAISLFSGAGGLDIGTQLAGVKVVASLDFDKDSIKTLKSNRCFNHAKHILGDVSHITAEDYKQVLQDGNPEKLIIVGGPPCQPFSKAGYWVSHKNRLGSEDPRNMIGHFLRLVGEIKPDGFLLENVESILHPKNINAAIELEEEIDRLGYNHLRFKANAVNFGIPQRRKRVFFFASRKSIDSSPVFTHGEQIPGLFDPNLQPIERVIDWIEQYSGPEFFEPEEVVHGKTYASELFEVPPGKNYIALTAKCGYPNPKFEAHKRFWSFLLKLDPHQPSWTIAAQPGPWVGPFHWANRRLRVPEIAAIQTFPADYVFTGTRRSIQKQIGNAVPSLLGKAMVEHLLKYV